MKKAYVIYCKDGIVCKGEKGQYYWSWEYEQMDMYAEKNKGNGVARYLGKEFLHLTELGYDITFLYEDKEMQELL